MNHTVHQDGQQTATLNHYYVYDHLKFGLIVKSSMKPQQIELKTLQIFMSIWRFTSKFNNTCIQILTSAEGNIEKTRNTFCGTWYLPHSRVHKSIAELCGNFGDSAITKPQIVYFSLRMRKTVLFLLSVKIWRHHRVRRPRFPIRCRYFGDSVINMGQIAYFSLRMRKTALFLLPVKNLTSPSVFPDPDFL